MVSIKGIGKHWRTVGRREAYSDIVNESIDHILKIIGKDKKGKRITYCIGISSIVLDRIGIGPYISADDDSMSLRRELEKRGIVYEGYQLYRIHPKMIGKDLIPKDNPNH